jgi:hypothetical protein
VKLECFLGHPGLEPGSRMHCRSLQKAVLNAGSRVFARDDKEVTTTQAIHASSGWIKSTGVTPAKKSRSERAAIIDAIGPEIP